MNTPVYPTASPASRGNTALLVIIAMLLAVLVASELYGQITTYQQNQIAVQRAAAYQQRVAEARKIVDGQRDVILKLMDSYNTDAYGNDQVDRIAEQQLLAAEYSLQALQVVAIQNSQIIELLAEAP